MRKQEKDKRKENLKKNTPSVALAACQGGGGFLPQKAGKYATGKDLFCHGANG